MNAPLRLAAFGAGLVVMFGAAFTAGAIADPGDGGSARSDGAMHGGSSEDAHAMSGMAPDRGEHAATTSQMPPGLAVAQDGYTLVPAATSLPAGRQVPFRFSVTGPDGAAVTGYRPTHTKELHLIAVRRDLAGFQHVHPTRAADGTWSVPLDLTGGSWRVFADFAPTAIASGLTLGTDVAVAGDFRPMDVPPATGSTRADGYRVALGGSPVAGHETELTFTVSRGGVPVTTLQPYLGAFGHLVSLRTGDLAYLHTHPADEATSGRHGGPSVRFSATFPTAGRYRLFLDFRAGGTVHTAEFTVDVPAGSPRVSDEGGNGSSGSHGH